MAQVINYFSNDIVFAEGPFVICNPLGNGWRIEVELKGHCCPVLPDSSIYVTERSLGLVGKTWDKSLAEKVCDELNEMVRDGKIVLSDKVWVEKNYGRLVR